MGKLPLFIRWMAMAFIKLMVVFSLLIHVADAETKQGRGYQWKLSNKPFDASVDGTSAKNNHVNLETWFPKQTYKIDEPIILNLSIQNRTHSDLFIDIARQIQEFDVSIREEKRGVLPLSEKGIELKPKQYPIGSVYRVDEKSKKLYRKTRGLLMSVRLKPEEGSDSVLSLRSLYDIGVGNYEVIVRRKLSYAGKTTGIEAESKPIEFNVTK